MQSANSIALASLKQSTGALGTVSRILLSALNESLSEDGPLLSARSVNSACETMPEIWARCDHNILVHIDTVASQSLVFCESRLDAVAHALDAADPILCAVESITGFVLDPIEMVKTQPIEHAIFEISRINEIDRIFVAFPTEIHELSEFDSIANRKSIDLSDLPVEYSLIIKSPILDIDSVSDISIGDLVILGSGPTKSIIKWKIENQTQFTVEGSYDFIGGEFAGDSGSVHETIVNDADDTDQADRDNATLFPVSLKVSVNGLVAEAKHLAALQSGVPFNVGKLTHGLEVSIIFGGKEIFAGYLVNIGDHFAVSINKKKYTPEEDIKDMQIAGIVS